MEIYLERIRDLLCRTSRAEVSSATFLIEYLFTAQNDNLQVHEEKSKGVYVKNLSDYYVSSAREVYEIMRTGGAARIVSATSTWLLCYLNLFVLTLSRYER